MRCASSTRRFREVATVAFASIKPQASPLATDLPFTLFNRGAADLAIFAIANERHLNDHGSEWRERRIISRIALSAVGRLASSVLFRSLPFFP